jgi:hypothetical protein
MSLIMSKWIRRGGTDEMVKEWMCAADGGRLSESGRLLVRCESNTRMNVREIDLEKGSHMEVAEDRTQWRVFWLALLNVQVIMLKTGFSYFLTIYRRSADCFI